MQPKDVLTLRVSQLAPDLQKADLLHFFNRNKLRASPGISLCPSTSAQGASLVATVTFGSPSDAKKALKLDQQYLGKSSICIEREFIGFTVLATPEEPTVE